MSFVIEEYRDVNEGDMACQSHGCDFEGLVDIGATGSGAEFECPKCHHLNFIERE